MKRVILLLICSFALHLSFGQQDKQLTHYNFDRMSYNPAATGFKGICGTAIYRNQWDRVQDAPNTFLFNAQMNIPNPGIGVGISFTHDAIGFQKNNFLTVNGAYHLPTAAGHLSAGIGLGIVNIGFDPDWIPPQNPSDPLLPGNFSETGFDVNLGLFWQGTQPYYVGISTTHLAPPTLDNINFSVARHYYVLAGYDFTLPGPRRIDIKPNTLIKADGAGMIFDINVLADFWMSSSSYLWGGFSYRMQDAVAISAGWAWSPAANTRVSMAKVGYSFDIMTNPLNTYGRGTHEIMLNFCYFPPPKGRGRHGNPFIMDYSGMVSRW